MNTFKFTVIVTEFIDFNKLLRYCKKGTIQGDFSSPAAAFKHIVEMYGADAELVELKEVCPTQ